MMPHISQSEVPMLAILICKRVLEDAHKKVKVMFCVNKCGLIVHLLHSFSTDDSVLVLALIYHLTFV